jgi:hypothetical protein
MRFKNSWITPFLISILISMVARTNINDIMNEIDEEMMTFVKWG